MLNWLFSQLDLGYRVYDRARQQLDDEEYAKALWWAGVLRRMRFSGAYEVEALVYREQGKLGEAAASLEEGIQFAPGVWLLHNLLGSTYSDLGRYDDALKCYDKARKCEHSDADFISYNQSVVLKRQNRLQEALDLCPERSRDPGLNSRVRGFRLELLYLLKRTEEAIRLAEESLKATSQEDEPEESFVGLFLAKLTVADDPQRGLREAVACLKCDMGRNLEAQELVDSLLPESPTYRFSFWFEGTARLPTSSSASFLIILVQVVATSEEEALNLYRGEQMEQLRDLPLKKSENRGRFPENQRGIFFGPVHISSGAPSLWERIKDFFTPSAAGARQ